jgi:hypothetical protein
MKHSTIFISVFFAVIFLIPIALAEDGCFTYGDSPLYCKTTPIEEAQDECSLYDDCSMESAFASGTCDDVSTFPSCQKVLCKSSCSETFVEECTAGVIPEEAQAEWCSSGCCKFSYSEEKFCDYKPSKWLCEIEAKNKNAVQFNFGIATEEECANSCADTTVLPNKENIPMEPSTKNISKTNLTNGTGKTETGSSGLGWFLVFLLVVIVGGVIFYYRKLISFNISKFSPKSEEELENIMPSQKTEDDDNFSKTLWKYLIKERLKPLTDKYQHKVKTKHREEFLREAGLMAEPKPETVFSKLKKLAHKSKRHEHPVSKPKEEKKALERLNELNVKSSPNSLKDSSVYVKPISKRNEAMEELKKVAKGK